MYDRNSDASLHIDGATKAINAVCSAFSNVLADPSFLERMQWIQHKCTAFLLGMTLKQNFRQLI